MAAAATTAAGASSVSINNAGSKLPVGTLPAPFGTAINALAECIDISREERCTRTTQSAKFRGIIFATCCGSWRKVRSTHLDTGRMGNEAARTRG